MKHTETQLVSAVLNVLAFHRVFAWRNNSTGIFDPTKGRFRSFNGLKGTSDIIGILPGGRFIGVECKVGKNKPTPEQSAFLDTVRELGGVGVLAYSVDDVLKVLADLGVAA